MSVFTAREYVCSTLELQEFKLFLRAVLKTWSRYTALIVSFVLHLFHNCLLLTTWQPVLCIGLGSSVVADAIIASSMCWYLYRRRTGFARHEFIFFPVYAPNLTELRIQNRFHDHDLDELQYQFRSIDMVRS